MTLRDFNNIRLEYSLGATVIMFSLIDTSIDKSILTPNTVSKVIIEYSQNNNTYTHEESLSFHCNSCLIIVSNNIVADSDIYFRVYISYEENNEEIYKIAITDQIYEHTLPIGNITYTILDSEDLQYNIINQLTSTMDNIISYINNLGTYVDESFDLYAQYAKNIPVAYNEYIATADAMYYKYYSNSAWGIVQTSGGSYFKNNVMYHELRHRYGINGLGSIFTRNDNNDSISSLYNYIDDDFVILHNALKFESGRDDAKVWIFGAHSNILEGTYTDNDDNNYLAANYIKALVWYTCHNISDIDNSKIRTIVSSNITLISGNLDEDIPEYNISLNIIGQGNVNVSHNTAKTGTQITISNFIPNNSNYEFDQCIVLMNNDESVQTTNNSSNDNYEVYFDMPDSDVIIIVKFIKKEDEIDTDDNVPNIIIVDNNDNKSKHKINVSTKLKTINIGPYQYLYEYLKNDEDFHDVGCYENYVILRNFDIINNIVYDKDIMFIEKDIYDKLINNLGDDLICYPIYKNGNLFFSSAYGFFLSYNINLKDAAYIIYNEDNKNENDEILASEANILCDKLRIYNPVVNKNLDYIIYVDNYINNIHFHYFCNLNKHFGKQYIGEIKVNNSRYIEYIEINIPNIKKLFDEQNKYFIIEDFNKISFEKDFKPEEYFEKYDDNHNKIIKKYDNKLYLSKLIKPFIIDKDINIIDDKENITYIKTYIDDKYFNYNNNFINTSLNITLYPYQSVQNSLYILHELLNSSSTFIPYETYFRLSSYLSFDNGIISLINEFIFPNKIKKPLLKYKYDYDNLNINKNPKEINEDNNDNEIDKQVVEYYNTYYLHENLNNIMDLNDEFDKDLDIEEIRSTGFVIQIANDLSFENPILESIINTDNNNDNFIYDFSFSLNDMVESWSQLNDILIMRARFIDKRLNIVITGNNVVINKEQFKYLINDTNHYNIQFNKINNLITNNFMDINKGFNFIDNLNCTVVENTNNINQKLNNNVVNTKIIYKPIFFKVQELQNIRIRQGVTQKIGINLGEFMNKVNLFILSIGDITIQESSRNDVFVIFSINANDIENNSGYYNILDDNFEYISSGNYIKY